MTGKPNNFPREGMHTTVTREAVRRLEAGRPTPNAQMHYTIGGTVETVVHSDVNAGREAAINAGNRLLEQSSQNFRAEFKRTGGDSRAAYVREQRTLSEHWREHARGKDHTPSR